MGLPPSRPRSPEDTLPRGGIEVVQDGTASIRYQLVARALFTRAFVVIRLSDNGEVALSVHQQSTIDPCGVPRLIRRRG